jgi:hypothetical protein
MHLKEYLEKIKVANQEELFALNNAAIADDEISAKEFGQVRVAVERRKPEINAPMYITGQRMRYDDQD